MSQTTGAISGARDISAGQLKGSARGAIICAGFGSAFMYWCVAWSGSPSPVWFSVVTVPAVVLMAWAILRARAVRHLPSSSADLAHWMRFRKFFWMDSGIEWGLMGVAVFVLGRLGRPDLIPQAAGVIIGLHFLPLAKIFRAPLYYWTGGIMVLAELGSLLTHRGYPRNIVGCAAAGLTFWVTGVVILSRTSSALAAQSRSSIPTSC